MNKKTLGIALIVLTFLFIGIFSIISHNRNSLTLKNFNDKRMEANYDNDEKNTIEKINDFRIEAKEDIFDNMKGVRYRLSFKINSLYATDEFLATLGFELLYKNKIQSLIGKSSSGINYSKILISKVDNAYTYIVDFYDYNSSFNDVTITTLLLSAKTDISAKLVIKDKTYKIIDNISN